MAQSSDEAAASPHDAEIARILSLLPDRTDEPSARNVRRLAYAIGARGIDTVMVEGERPPKSNEAVPASLAHDPDDSEESRTFIARGMRRVQDIIALRRDEICKLRDHPAFNKKNRDPRTIIRVIAAIIDAMGASGAAGIAVAIYFIGLDNICANKSPAVP